MNNCTACLNTVTPGLHACHRCTEQLRIWLGELPTLASDLEDFLQPLAAPAAGRTGPTGRAHAPLPLDVRVLSLLGPGQPIPPPDEYGDADHSPVPIRAFLYGWADYLASEFPAVTRDRHGTTHIWPCQSAAIRRTAPAITAWCRWHTAYLPHSRTRPWIGDLYHQLDNLQALIRDLTHTTPHHHPQAAPCPNCRAFALVRTDGKWGITCTACHHHLDPTEYEQHAAQFLKDMGKDHPAPPTPVPH